MSCWQDGNPDSPLLIVGMAPGREELAQDRPFIGGSGKLLWALAKNAGIDRADCYIVNTIGDWPEGKDGNPTPEQYSLWWDRFDAAVEAFTGSTCIALGTAAFWRLTGLPDGIDSWRGYIVGADEMQPLQRTILVNHPYKTANKAKGRKVGDPRWVRVRQTVDTVAKTKSLTVYPALHPAGIMRSGFATLPLLAGDLKRVRRALDGCLRPSRDSYTESAWVLGSGADNRPVAVDIETGGQTSDFSDIVRIGMADATDAWSDHWSSHSRDIARQTLSSPDRPVIIHNAGFDVPRLGRAGAPVLGPLRDTMFAAALLQPDLKKGLNAVASMYLDCKRWKHEAEARPAYYNALDAIREFELWIELERNLTSTHQLGLFSSVLMHGLPVLIGMGQQGILLDNTRRETWVQSLQRDIDRLGNKWQGLAPGINPNSTHQLKAFFRTKGMEIPYNKYGAESLDKQAMQTILSLNPEHESLIATLADYKGVLKDLSTYANPPLGSDGAVHPNFTPAFKDEDSLGKGLTGTWRPTAKEPNLQNQPPEARLMYIPRPGKVFVGGDYRQLEARLLAAYSSDAALMAACDAGIHEVNAAKLKVDKTSAKISFYGWGYLIGARSLHMQFKGRGMHVSVKDCQALLDSFDREYSVAAAFRQRIIAESAAKRFVENGFGLRRYFPQQSFPAPAAMATHIQSSGAMMMWHTMEAHQAAAQAHGGNILLMVHDDVLWEVDEDKRDSALVALRDIMTQPFDQVAPGWRCPITPKWSASSWGEMQEAVLA